MISALKPRTLRGKVTMAITLLLILGGGVQLSFVALFWLRAGEEQLQALQWGLAEDLERSLRPYVSTPEGLDTISISKVVHDYQSLNENINVYLLDKNGKIVLDLSEGPAASRTAVELQPMESALLRAKHEFFPARGSDPASASGKVAFLVARTKIQDQPGYVYITLKNTRSQATGLLFLQFLSFRYVVLGTIIVMISFIALGALVSKAITARFGKVILTLHAFRQGQLSSRVNDSVSDELGLVGSAIDSMAAAIEQHVGSLEEKDALRRELIMNVWHDLRGPVSTIKGRIDLLEIEQESLKESERSTTKQSYAVMSKSVDLLNRMLSELLELSQLETKDRTPELQQCNIEQLCDDVLLSHQGKAQERGIELVIESDSSLPCVQCDQMMILRVLNNFVENALRHTPSGGKITLEIRHGNQRVSVSVRDTGSGIPEEALPHIFDRHYQGPKDPLRPVGSSGLGLTIVKRILEAHGSEVLVESIEGKGTAFSFSLAIA